MSRQGNSIFVALASYCEPELMLTVGDCIARADHPDNLRFGICHQFDPEGEPAIRAEAVRPLLEDDRFRVSCVHHADAQGGPWARNLVQGFYEGEDFTLQVDAHSRFAPSWDTELLRMCREFPSPKPLITGFPPLYNREQGVDLIPGYPDGETVPVTVVDSWSQEGWIHHVTVPMPANCDHPRRTRVLSGAFVFTTGQWNVEVRQDPQHIYTGEEFALTLRSYTSGYDLFNPDRVVVWHRNHPHGRRDYVGDRPDGLVQARHMIAMRRLETLLEGDPDHSLGPYSLGSVRSLDDYRVFSGLDCDARTIHADALTGRTPDPVTISDAILVADGER